MGRRHKRSLTHSQLLTLWAKYNGKCHYCKRLTDRVGEDGNSPNAPTREHIVPRSLGGCNDMENYVLACRKCNESRGTILFFCSCRDCNERILDALYDPESLEKMFKGIIAHNKPKISIVPIRNPNKYKVKIGHQSKYFYNFEDAIKFATVEMSLVRKKNYKEQQ